MASSSLERFTGFVERKLGVNEPLTPPLGTRLSIGLWNSWSPRTYHQVARNNTKAIVELTGLGPSDGVLDVGCGCGRIASALTSYLGPGGRYEGIDVQERSVDWDQRVITAAYPNFRFQATHTSNRMYNPDATSPSSSYRFPFGDEHFDVTLAISLFTHLLPDEAVHYVREVYRVLKPGGRFFSTWWLFEPSSRSTLWFSTWDKEVRESGRITFGVCDPKLPEENVAYTEGSVSYMLKCAGFRHLTSVKWSDPNGAAFLSRWRFRANIIVTEKPPLAGT